MVFDLLALQYYKTKNYVDSVMEYKILHRPIRWKRWGGHRIIDGITCNDMITNILESGEAFVAARLGNVEVEGILMTLSAEWRGVQDEEYEKIKRSLSNNAGMFSNDEAGIRAFTECWLQAMEKIDLLGFFSKNTEYLIKKYAKNAKVTRLESLEPYYYEKPWSKALEAKKVLVIHPFADTIEKQYRRRGYLWENKDILPDFELITFKAVQTIAGQRDDRFSDWIEALEYMKAEIKKIDFDIAIVGCGAYGLPLAVSIKEMGKQAIHLGGATQILFGIMGKRWEDWPFFRQKMNDYWVKPDISERPSNAGNVEEGCYW